MGLPIPLMRFLAREHRRQPFTGRVLTLGRQCLYATCREIEMMLADEQIPITPLPPDMPSGTNIPQWKGTLDEANTSDVAFFWLLGGLAVQALDVSDFEGADITHDLNRPVAADLHEQFDLILDSGTLEHIFHVPQVLANVVRMLRRGGRVVHFTPTNNYTNHGFYQISPTLYADFYRANHFQDVRVFVAEQGNLRDPRASMRVYDLTARQPEIMLSSHRLLSLAIATKTDASTPDTIPMQGYYSNLFEGDAKPAAGEADNSWGQRLRRMLPVPLKTLARRWIPGLDPFHRPWRLPFWGRLD